MRKLKIAGLLLFAVVFAMFTRNNAKAIGRHAHPLLAAFQVQGLGASQLQILAPKQGEKIANDSVTVTYALQRTATVQSTPIFQLRLDANDAVQVSDTSYTFNGLQPGNHTVSVQCVDANGVPVPNTQSEIQFTVVQSQSLQTGDGTVEVNEAGTLPTEPGEGPLSVLGVVGFGVLVGGALSMQRTRSEQEFD